MACHILSVYGIQYNNGLFKILSPAPTLNRMHRTGLLTASAADTLRAVAVFHRVYFHLARLCTFSTVNTFIHIHTVTVNRHLIKYGIKCAKRTDISAERSVYNNGKKNRHDQNSILPYVKPSNRPTHCLVQKHQGKSAFQGSCRADQLAEIRRSLSHNICENQRKQNHKHQENHIL